MSVYERPYFNPYGNMNLREDPKAPYTATNGPLPIEAGKKFIIDCDVGPDDAHGLVLAFDLAKKKGLDILGITAVAGNTYVKNCVINSGIV